MTDSKLHDSSGQPGRDAGAGGIVRCQYMHVSLINLSKRINSYLIITGEKRREEPVLTEYLSLAAAATFTEIPTPERDRR